ncbi:MAG: hypothetical protein AAFX08_10355 [Pseudomonadota bacterium]
MSELRLGDAGYRRRQDKGEYRFYVALLFPFCLCAAALGRIAPGRREYRGLYSKRRSLISEAGEMAGSVVPWVFGGR